MCIHSKLLIERDCYFCIKMKGSGPAIVGTIGQDSAPAGNPQTLAAVGPAEPNKGSGDLYDQFEYQREHHEIPGHS